MRAHTSSVFQVCATPGAPIRSRLSSNVHLHDFAQLHYSETALISWQVTNRSELITLRNLVGCDIR